VDTTNTTRYGMAKGTRIEMILLVNPDFDDNILGAA
jgi:hypothetical protein